MFKPDFSAMSSFSGFINVLKTAAGQMFFSLSPRHGLYDNLRLLPR